MQWVRANKVISFAVLGYAVLALGHIPSNVLLSLFDKNQSVQFAAILFLSAAFGVIAIIKRESLQLPRIIFFLGLALIIVLFASAILSGSFFLSLTGDSLRYAGIASTVALATVALFHGLFKAESFPKLVSGYLFILFLTEVIAILQYF